MNLLVVSTWLPYPPNNGSRMRAYRLLQQLARRHSLTLLSFGPGEPEDLPPLRALCKRVEVVAPTPLRDGRLWPRGLLSGVPRYFVLTESPGMRSLVAMSVPHHDCAIGLQVEAARYLGEWTQIPRVFEEAEVAVYKERYLRDPDLLRRWRHGLTWFKFRRFIRRLIDSFEQTTVVSEQERQHLLAIGCNPGRVSVVPNGADVPQVDLRGIRVARLIYPGSVTYSANLDAVRYFVREVFPIVRRAQPDVGFWVTGATDGVDVSDLSATGGVAFTGQLAEVDTLIAESAACVVPLRIGGGTRLKVLHAMALGTPVVSTTKGIEGLDVEPERHVLVADSPSGVAQQVLRLLGDPDLGRRLAAEAKRLVEARYTWGSIGDTLARVLQSAIVAHTSRRARSREPTG